MTDALDEPEFRQRAAKLLAVLSADNPAEAEAARQKLRAHLASRQLSMLDLAERIAAAPVEGGGSVRSLQEALRRSRAETLEALRRATEAERALGRRRARSGGRNVAAAWVATVAGAVLAAGAGAAGWTWLHARVLSAPRRRTQFADTIPAPRPAPQPRKAAPPAPGSPVFSWQPEPTSAPTPAVRPGFVRADNTQLRDGASDAARLHALLARGTSVIVLRSERRAGEAWSLVQTPAGQGYVATAAITLAPP